MSTRVLVVEDERAIQLALSGLLKKMGYEIVQAHSGDEALAELAKAGFDLVITDLSLGRGPSGMDVLQAARAMQIPVVMITAHGSEKVAVEAMKAGAEDYVPKPFDNDEMRLVVSRAIEHTRLEREHRLPTAITSASRRRKPRCSTPGSPRSPTSRTMRPLGGRARRLRGSTGLRRWTRHPRSAGRCATINATRWGGSTSCDASGSAAASPTRWASARRLWCSPPSRRGASNGSGPAAILTRHSWSCRDRSCSIGGRRRSGSRPRCGCSI
jgi:CheY-like chemotaxis protein